MNGAFEQDLPINGHQLHVQTIGRGTPLLLLMGLGAAGDKWAPNVEVYKEHFRCILVDNVGAGRSDKPQQEAYSVKEMARDAAAVLDALGVEQAHVNGISMGGAIAQELAIAQPQRVRSLILTSTFGSVSNSFRTAIETLRDNIDVLDKATFKQELAIAQPQRVRSLILTSTFGSVSNSFRTAIETLRDNIDVLDKATFKRLNQWMTFAQKTQNTRPEFLVEMAQSDATYPYPMPSYAYKAQCNACLGHNAADRLKNITAPTLVAAGACDLFVPYDKTMELCEKIPNATLYLCKDGGHVHEWEHLEDYNRVTLEFLLAHDE